MLPKTIKIVDRSYQIVETKLKEGWKLVTGKDGDVLIQVDSRRSPSDQNAALFSAVCDIIDSRSAEVTPKIAWGMFIRDNVFEVDWLFTAVKPSKKAARIETQTILEDLGDDLKIIKRSGH